ncbi:methyl-accepting chemotaxis protein [Ammoniphilus oxalaticus]|uniref:methyl-accepting chemotaxis protein n=1 Tax=Ammoniphilus oxalaticus TaxID=66863 RepID=UPI00147539A1|nr:methyl-accepting chemotaxis protein [Ammoniphilus oxalaticus]
MEGVSIFRRYFSSLSIRTKLLFLFSAILIFSFSIKGYQETITLEKTIQGEALEKARSDLQTGLAIIDLTYPGDWRAEGEKLYKGETLINNNFEIVDLIGELTEGDTVTIFLHNKRVTTNVLVDGQRAVGTTVSDLVAERVLGQGELFLGQANVVGHTYQSAYMPLKDRAGEIIGIWYVGAPDASDRIQQIQKDNLLAIIVQVFALLIIAIGLNTLLTRPMIRRIKLASERLQMIADGDLTFENMKTNSNDETGLLVRATNRVKDDLREILSNVRETTWQVASSSEQLTAIAGQNSEATEQITIAMQEVAVGSEQQSTRFMEANEAVSTIAQGIDRVSESIDLMTSSSTSANEKARSGTETVLQTIEQMNRAQLSVGETVKVIDSLEETSREINHILEVITQIADQTNLLSLNAAIEAARAGEHGRGFSVVADEVRKLAEQSAGAAEQIHELIKQVQSESNKAAASMNESATVVAEGISRVRLSGEAFNEIVHSVTEISKQSLEVTNVLEQVKQSGQDMVQTVAQAADLSQDTSGNTQQVAAAAQEQNASMEEIAVSADSLSNLVEELRGMITRFKL